ncbi:MAG: PEP-CTERM sorting domain-containing protein [Sedimentisphaerales bacterium]|nr:PEP-CTERM sorting domain-containing protein [Sedimentisphaerales bacterium]
MRKSVCLIVVLMITAPALATVNFKVSAVGTQVTIGVIPEPMTLSLLGLGSLLLRRRR